MIGKNKMGAIRAAVIAVGLVILERFGDELLEMVNDGLLDPIVKAILGA